MSNTALNTRSQARRQRAAERLTNEIMITKRMKDASLAKSNETKFYEILQFKNKELATLNSRLATPMREGTRGKRNGRKRKNMVS